MLRAAILSRLTRLRPRPQHVERRQAVAPFTKQQDEAISAAIEHSANALRADLADVARMAGHGLDELADEAGSTTGRLEKRIRELETTVGTLRADIEVIRTTLQARDELRTLKAEIETLKGERRSGVVDLPRLPLRTVA